MKKRSENGTGSSPPAAHYWPAARVPDEVTIARGRLRAPPTMAPVKPPVAGAWRNLADTDPDDLAQIERIARRFGGLTAQAGQEEGEDLDLWRALIADLRQLTVGWDDAGQVTGGAATVAAYALHTRVIDEHLDRGGRFRAFFDGHHWLVCVDMAQWWRLEAVADVYVQRPLRRCRYCQSWFSLADGRADRGFCSGPHRSAFNQRRKPAAPLFWVEVL